MDILLNRRGGVPVRDQLVTQIELKMLSGALKPGQKLPSVRALARQLHIHANTVAAAYRDLRAAGHAEVRKGSGVYALCTGPSTLGEARGLDEMIRMALGVAFHRGFTGAEIRGAVARWMAAAPPERLLFIDPVDDARELFMAELRRVLQLPVSGCRPEELSQDGDLMTGALGVCLPYHIEALRARLPGAPLETVNLELAEAERGTILKLPSGSLVVLVSHASTVLPFAEVLGRTLRGDEILVEACLLSDARRWRRLCTGADLVLADTLAMPHVERLRPRRLRELRLIGAASVARLRSALEWVAPHPSARGARA